MSKTLLPRPSAVALMPARARPRYLGAALACALVWLPGKGRGVEPLPGESRITMEARISPAQVFAPATVLELCVQNVNRRTATSQALVQGDAWVFRVDPACG